MLAGNCEGCLNFNKSPHSKPVAKLLMWEGSPPSFAWVKMLSVPLPLTTAFAFSHPGGSLYIEEWPSHYTASRRQTGQLGLCHGSP